MSVTPIFIFFMPYKAQVQITNHIPGVFTHTMYYKPSNYVIVIINMLNSDFYKNSCIFWNLPPWEANGRNILPLVAGRFTPKHSTIVSVAAAYH